MGATGVRARNHATFENTVSSHQDNSMSVGMTAVHIYPLNSDPSSLANVFHNTRNQLSVLDNRLQHFGHGLFLENTIVLSFNG